MGFLRLVVMILLTMEASRRTGLSDDGAPSLSEKFVSLEGASSGFQGGAQCSTPAQGMLGRGAEAVARCEGRQRLRPALLQLSERANHASVAIRPSTPVTHCLHPSECRIDVGPLAVAREDRGSTKD